jgi:hypothetical protein
MAEDHIAYDGRVQARPAFHFGDRLQNPETQWGRLLDLRNRRCLTIQRKAIANPPQAASLHYSARGSTITLSTTSR